MIVRTAVLLATVLAASLTPLLWPAASDAATSAAASTTAGTTSNPAATTSRGTTTTSGGIGSCEQYPPMASFVSATSSSLTFAITWSGPNCGYGGDGRLTLNTSKSFEGAITVAVSPGTNVTVPNLRSNTAYYWGTQGSSPVSSGWQGPASTLPYVSPTTTTIACDPMPPTVSFVSATATSLTFTYQAFGTASCGGQGLVTIRVSPDRTQANSVSVLAAWPSGTVTVPNLASGTAYFYTATGGGSPFGNSWFGPVSTLTGTTTTTTTRTIVCDPLPPTIAFASATSTSLTFTYQAHGTAGCGGQGAVQIRVSPDQTLANSVTVSAPWPSGSATVSGLTPGTAYYFLANGGGSPFGGIWNGPASTLGGTTTRTTDGGNGCSATYSALSAWPGNFMANLVVTNISPVGFKAWRVTWTWPGGQTLVAAYSATAGGSGANPVVTNPSWGGTVPSGGKAETVLMGAGSPPATAPVLTCTVLG